MNKIKLTIAIFALILVGCSDDDNPVSSSVTLTEGTYNLTAATMYDTADCSGTGYSGMCFTDETATTEANCPSDGWMSLTELIAVEGEDVSLIFGADDVFTNPDGETGTYTIDGTTITIVDGDEGAITGTLNADGTVSVELSDTDGCYDDDYEEVDAADEDACDTAGGDWEDASCTSLVFTLSTSQ